MSVPDLKFELLLAWNMHAQNIILVCPELNYISLVQAIQPHPFRYKGVALEVGNIHLMCSTYQKGGAGTHPQQHYPVP